MMMHWCSNRKQIFSSVPLMDQTLPPSHHLFPLLLLWCCSTCPFFWSPSYELKCQLFFLITWLRILKLCCHLLTFVVKTQIYRVHVKRHTKHTHTHTPQIYEHSCCFISYQDTSISSQVSSQVFSLFFPHVPISFTDYLELHRVTSSSYSYKYFINIIIIITRRNHLVLQAT